MVLKAMEVAAI